MAKKASKSPRKSSAQKTSPSMEGSARTTRTATKKDGRGRQGGATTGQGTKKSTGSRTQNGKPAAATNARKATPRSGGKEARSRGDAGSAPAATRTTRKIAAPAGERSESRSQSRKSANGKATRGAPSRSRKSATPSAYRPGVSRAAATARAAAEELARAVSLAVDTAVSEAVSETVHSSAASTARLATTRTEATAKAAAEELTRAVNQAVANLAASHAAARAQQMEREKEQLEQIEAEYSAAEKPARRDVQRGRPAAPPAAPAASQRPLVRVRKRVGPRPNVVWETYPEPIQKLVDMGRQTLGIDNLRPGQAESLAHIMAGRDLLAVMPTGSGKSLLYQLPSLVLPGLTVVVSPLIALIKDQIDKMVERGVPVCRFDSTLTVRQERDTVELMRAPGGKLVLTTPERMAMPEFRELLLTGAGGAGVSMFVVDEAHCVSQWGHDFRPSYLTLRKALDELGRPQVLATTATAPPHVRDDILHQLGMEEARVVTTTFERPNLHFEVIALPGEDDKMKTLVTLLKKLPKPGVVYCATVKKVDELWEKLFRHDIHVVRYHGRMTKKERDSQQQLFMDSRDLVMIATNAFGLGVDKANIRYVLHYHVPGSLEAYAQEAGRAGRDGKPARCVLLFSPDDVAIQEYFLTGTYPTRRQVRAVYNSLTAWSEHDAPPTVSNLALGSRVGTQRARTVLSLLKDEGFVVEREDSTFWLADPPPTDAELNDKARQYEARRIADRQRLDALLDYVRAPGCRNQVILSYLGESDIPECGRCDNCLRSRDAALAAADRATRLEESLTDALNREWGEDTPKPRRVIRHRVIRIDEPAAASESGVEAAAAAGSGAAAERLERGQHGQESGQQRPAREEEQPGADVIRRRRPSGDRQMTLPLSDVAIGEERAHGESARESEGSGAKRSADSPFLIDGESIPPTDNAGAASIPTTASRPAPGESARESARESGGSGAKRSADSPFLIDEPSILTTDSADRANTASIPTTAIRPAPGESEGSGAKRSADSPFLIDEPSIPSTDDADSADRASKASTPTALTASLASTASRPAPGESAESGAKRSTDSPFRIDEPSIPTPDRTENARSTRSASTASLPTTASKPASGESASESEESEAKRNADSSFLINAESTLTTDNTASTASSAPSSLSADNAVSHEFVPAEAAEYEYEDEYEDGEDEYEDDEYEDDEYEDDEYEDGEDEYYEGEDEDEDEEEDEYEDEDYEEGEDEDDEYEYEYYDDDEEIEAIDKTAAALAEEGLDTSDNEITILARKRVPKPPRGVAPEVEDADEAGKRKRKRRRRRRKKRGLLPPKSAFTSPVLSQPAPAPETHRHRGRRGSRGSGPVIEYVRGPMRINMTPVASATPNDVAPSRTKKKRRFRRGEDDLFAGSGYESTERGRRRRKRRKRRRRGGPGGAGVHDEPVAFFSVQWPAGEGPPPPPADSVPAGKKRRRRRRRRGRGGRGNPNSVRQETTAKDSADSAPDSDPSTE